MPKIQISSSFLCQIKKSSKKEWLYKQAVVYFFDVDSSSKEFNSALKWLCSNPTERQPFTAKSSITQSWVKVAVFSHRTPMLLSMLLICNVLNIQEVFSTDFRRPKILAKSCSFTQSSCLSLKVQHISKKVMLAHNKNIERVFFEVA